MRLPRFHRDQTGSATVEFVAIALPFFLIVLFVVEVSLAFWWKSAEKATMLGAALPTRCCRGRRAIDQRED